jgi:hypothetical protein
MRTHGLTETAEYRVWRAMKTRCLNPNHDAFKHYGGKGIGIDEPWLSSFSAFLADMGPRPSAAHTLDRIDPTKNYGPSNCRWATWREQANNKRNNRALVIHGERMNITEACRRFGVSLNFAQRHLAKGECPNKIFAAERGVVFSCDGDAA